VAKKKRHRSLFQGLNLPHRASITSLGGETRSVPVSLPRISILQTEDDDGGRKVTQPTSE
jgi:hypothetical protein